MPDREKAIKGLTAIQDEAYDRWVHRQYIEDPLITLIKENISDVLDLLREQEPMEPDIGQVADGVYAVCANCRYSLKLLLDANGPKVGGYLPKFCPECGRAVKWMPDRVKVIKALARHKETAVCNGCPYAGDDDTPQGNCPVYDDAITLLREDDSMEDDGK